MLNFKNFKLELKKIFWQKLYRQLTIEDVGSNKPCFLFFALEAEIQPFHRTILKVAEIVIRMGFPARFLTCASELPFCSVHLLHHGLNPTKDQKNQDCYRCMKFAYRNHIVGSILIKNLSETKIISRHTDKKIKNLCLLNTYKNKAEASGGDIEYQKTDEFKVQNEAGIISYNHTRAVLEKNPEAIFVHINNYPLNLCGRLAAQELGHRSIGLVHSSLCNTKTSNIIVNQNFGFLESQKQSKSWKIVRNIPIPERIIQLIFEDLHERLHAKGSHRWSPGLANNPHPLPQAFISDQKSGRPILLAFTSSIDERHFQKIIRSTFQESPIQEKSLFSDQIAWLKHLAQWCSRMEINLWIRIHPRTKIMDCPCEISDAAENLKDLYPNVRVVSRDDPISSYNLMQFADAGVYGWSSMGLEMACLAMPVISYQSGYAHYPPESVGPPITSLKSYERELLRAASGKASVNVIGAWRASALANLGCSIHDQPDYLRNLFNKEIMRAIFLKGDSPLKYYSKELNHERLSFAQERLEIKKCLKKLLTSMLLVGNVADKGGHLQSEEEANKKYGIPNKVITQFKAGGEKLPKGIMRILKIINNPPTVKISTKT